VIDENGGKKEPAMQPKKKKATKTKIKIKNQKSLFYFNSIHQGPKTTSCHPPPIDISSTDTLVLILHTQ